MRANIAVGEFGKCVFRSSRSATWLGRSSFGANCWAEPGETLGAVPEEHEKNESILYDAFGGRRAP